MIITKIIDSDKIHFVSRYHQLDATATAINYWNKNIGKFILFDHICRSGKTITALNTCKQMGFKNVLLITNFPCINEMEWGDTIQRFYDFEYWNVVNFSGKQGQFDSSKQNFVMVSFQDLKSNDKDNQNYGWNKPKFDDIRNIKWDCIIVDEVHYGKNIGSLRSRAVCALSEALIKAGGQSRIILLSATPFDKEANAESL
jgi:superfamily II DNA or RNA helicase